MVFLGLVLVRSDLPGIYMDAANPDFLAAQWLHRGHNPGAGIPSKVFPILGSFYHGLQNAYLGVPFFALAGFSVTSLRLEQATFGAILLVALFQLTRRLTGSRLLALLASLGLATEPRLHRVVPYAVLHRRGWDGMAIRVDAACSSGGRGFPDRPAPVVLVGGMLRPGQFMATSCWVSSLPAWRCWWQRGYRGGSGQVGSPELLSVSCPSSWASCR